MPTTHHGEENAESTEGHKENEEGRSDDVSDQRKTKRKKMEL